MAKPGRPRRDKETERREAEEMFAAWRTSDSTSCDTEAEAIEGGLRITTPHNRDDHFSVDPTKPQPVRRGYINEDGEPVFDTEETEMTKAEKAALRHANRKPREDGEDA